MHAFWNPHRKSYDFWKSPEINNPILENGTCFNRKTKLPPFQNQHRKSNDFWKSPEINSPIKILMNLHLLFQICILRKFWRFLSFFSLTQGLEMHRTFLFLFGSLLGLFWGWSFFCGASTTILCSKMIKKAIGFSLSLGLTLHNHVSQGIFRIIKSYFNSIYTY